MSFREDSVFISMLKRGLLFQLAPYVVDSCKAELRGQQDEMETISVTRIVVYQDFVDVDIAGLAIHMKW